MTIRVWTGHRAGDVAADQPISPAAENAVKQSLCIVAGMAEANVGKLNNWF
jgi:hypothetical protein